MRRSLAGSVVLLLMVAAGPGEAPAAAAGASCTTPADCPLPGAPCEICPGGGTACPLVSCVGGQCSYSFPACPATCPTGQTWCSINGRCTDPACLSCCQFGTTCAAAKDCGSACVTCADGPSSCTVGQCGTDLAGQCFYPEPLCPAPAPVPAVPRWIVLIAAAGLTISGARLITRRRRHPDGRTVAP